MSSKVFSRLFVFALFVLSASLSGFASSQVRIVRLSYVEGNVQIDRNTGKFEKAFTNLPITEGTKLRTGSESRAEVEFEDGSTLRLVPKTDLQFVQLSLQDGIKASTAQIVSGTAYVTFAGTKGNELTLQFAKEKLTLTHSAHLRIGVGEEGTSVAVLKGDVQVEAPSGTTAVKKGQTGEFKFSDDQLVVAKEIVEDPYDAWDKQQSQYHERYSNNTYSSYSTYNYGLADLNYYGNFFSAPGYGMLWQPYFVGAGWDPFMDGAWLYSGGYGFGWVSSYPWGWTPYHSGTWVFLPGYGWAWQPGGSWTTFYTPRVANAPSGFTAPKAPALGTNTVLVSRNTSALESGHSGNKLVIRNNSAGLGVPRGEINNMPKVSMEVQQHGAVTEHAHPAPVTASVPVRGGVSPELAPASVGLPPRSMSSGPTMSHPSSPATAPSAHK